MSFKLMSKHRSCRYKIVWGCVVFFSICYCIVGLALHYKLVPSSPDPIANKISRKLTANSSEAPHLFNLDLPQSIILMWTHPWDDPTDGIPEGTVVGNCLFTYNKQNLSISHAVVFHHTAIAFQHVVFPWPHFRHPDQIFIWFSMESPANIRTFMPHAFNNISEGFINWTMSYRTDSDIFYPYVNGEMLKSATEAGSNHVDSIISRKTRVALWVVRNCNNSKSAQDRWKYVDGLIAAGLPVDRYGVCFNNTKKYAEISNQPDIIGSYKFYLAFENGHNCRDYITEKFWDNGLLSGRVPVVWGPKKKDVLALVPPGSFIHTDDFHTPANLAAYLLYLNRSTTAYRRYFSWMEKPKTFDRTLKHLYLHTREELLCSKVRSNKNHTSIPNLRKHIFTNDRKICFD